MWAAVYEIDVERENCFFLLNLALEASLSELAQDHLISSSIIQSRAVTHESVND